MNIAHLLTDAYRNKSKIKFLKDLADTNTLFIGLFETFLNNNIIDEEICMEGFNVIRSDRIGRVGGGVCLYINQSVSYKTLLCFSNSMCEVLIVKLTNPDVVLVNIYRPPNASSVSFKEIVNKLESVIIALGTPLPNVFMIGDFNFPGVDWDTTQGDRQQISDLICVRDHLFLEQLITVPTRKSNILDLLFCCPSLINTIDVSVSPISDHNIIKVDTYLSMNNENSLKVLNPPKSLFDMVDYFKANWTEIIKSIAHSNIHHTVSTLNTQDGWITFLDTIGKICVDISPKKLGTKKDRPSKFFHQRKILMRRRTKVRKRLGTASQYRERVSLQNSINNIDCDILKSHNDERMHEELRAVNRIKSDSNYFFKYAKKFSNSRPGIGPLMNNDGDLVNNKSDMCDMLLNQFNSVFSKPMHEYKINDIDVFFTNPQSTNGQPSLTNIIFTEDLVKEAIKSMRLNSAPGPDGLNCHILKNCSAEISASLVILFTKSMSEGIVPDVCKQAVVVPVFKGGEISDPSNYRPVSLTSIMMKVMEKIVREQIVNYMSANNLFNPTQHGFRKGRSCLSALLRVYDEILLDVTENKYSCVDMIYLDFSKAFDKVDHGVLMHKLKKMGITGNVGKWLFSFLSHRKHYVRIPGGMSTEGLVHSGVPQGTVLGPLLFLILLSDISSGISVSNVISFADDTRIYSKIEGGDDCNHLQSDLAKIYMWAQTNNMVFNDKKFQHVCFNQKLIHGRERHKYVSPTSNIIMPTESTRDLGILMSENCAFEEHINAKIKQCRQLTGWILRTFSARDKQTMLTLFKSIVLPRIEYGCQLWSPCLLKHINGIESIQRSFTKHIQGMKSLSYQSRLQSLNMYSLQRRRDRYSAIYMWKIVENIVPNLQPHIETNTSQRRGRSCIISNVERGRIGSLTYGSFRWKGSRIFNSLPSKLRNISQCGVEVFKRELDYYLKTVPDNPCVPNWDNDLVKVEEEKRWCLHRNGLAKK